MSDKILKPIDTSSKVAAVAGPPLAIVSVLLWQRYVLLPGEILDPVYAAGIGAFGSAVLGEVGLILHRIVNRILPPTPHDGE